MLLFDLVLMESVMKKVFISSTYVDLEQYRRAAIEVVNHYKCVPLAMEFFDSLTEDPKTVCDKEIREYLTCAVLSGWAESGVHEYSQ